MKEGELFNGTEIMEFDDLVGLKDLNDETLLQSLKLRFSKNKVYTYIGSILISMNPYEILPIYGTRMMQQYRGKQIFTEKYLAPHVYGIAEHAYSSLIESKKSQSIIIAGESGAGKTESARIILEYLSDIAHNNQIDQKILDTNVILESFGNAKTIRNNNSSRFGKFIKLSFSQEGLIDGAVLTSYLLEKSRVVSHAMGERSYHVFYQLCAGADQTLSKKFFLGPATVNIGLYLLLIK